MLEALAGRSLPDWQRVEERQRTLRLEHAEPLFHAGQVYPYVCCVRQGAVKLVYDTPEGKSWTKAFCTPPVVFASLTALSHESVASFAAFAIGNTVVDRLDFRLIEALADEHIAWQRLLTNAFRIYGERKEKRERELLTLNAEQRYLQFLRDYPQLEQLIPQAEVAAYVRVTPVALSRIRARIRRQRASGQ